MRREPRIPEEHITHSRDNLYQKKRGRERNDVRLQPQEEAWVSAEPPRSYREERAYYEQSLKERRYRPRPEEYDAGYGYEDGSAYRDGYDEEAFYEAPSRRERKNGRRERKLREQEYRPAQKPKKPGRGKRTIKGIFIFILLLAVAFGVIWIVPGWRTAVTKAFLKSPVGPPVASLFIRGNYDRYVRDKNFDESGVVIHNGMSVPKGNRTIALFGIDTNAEELTAGARSDSIVVVNIDENGNMRMASVFRDSYLMCRRSDGTEIITKANAAYAVGGPLAAVNMLNENFDLGITDYIVVNFWGMESIIDLLGGLSLTISETEMNLINDYLRGVSDFTGREYIPLESYGEGVRLNGQQVTAFCRNRYSEFHSPMDGQTYIGDFGRAARQRYVLMELLTQTKSQGMLRLMSLANKLFAANSGEAKFVQSSMTAVEIIKLFVAGYDLQLEAAEGFPDLSHQYTAVLDSGDSIVLDTLEDNAALMHRFLYGQEDYVPTEELRSVADRIRNEVARQTG